jgi:hypothetical protein
VDRILDIFLLAKELEELVRICASDLGQLTLILDGIDEAQQPDPLGHRLKALVMVSPIKLILFSRPSVNSLRKLISQKHRIAVNREAMSADIRLFLEHQLDDMVENQKLPDSADIGQVAETLLNGADGMFLWARLMVRYLNSFALSPKLRLATIDSVRFPEGLNAMYDRIISLIATADAPYKDLARRILLWINYTAEDSFLTCKFLHEAVHDENEQEIPEDFVSIIISVCGGLVEFNQQEIFQFTHLTVKDYFRKRAWSDSNILTTIVPNASLAAEELTVRCLHHVCSRAPTESPVETLGSSSETSGLVYERSFGAYAIRYWASHLCDTAHIKHDQGDHEPTATILEAISGFLSNPFAVAFWIECSYGQLASVHTWIEEGAGGNLSEHLYRIQETADRLRPFTNDFNIKGSHSQIASIHTWIERWTRWTLTLHSHRVQETATRLLQFSNDLKTLDQEWGWKLRQNSSLIWTDVSIFSNIGIAGEIGKVVGTKVVTNMEPIAPIHDDGNTIRCLSTISSLTSDGDIMATLNIYPSSSFEQFWNSINPNTAYKEAERYCSDWTAKYEIWSTGSKVRIAHASLPLPEPEIRLLIRQSFRQDPYKQKAAIPYGAQDDRSFDTSFALAIGPDCLTFSILRTIYTITPGDSPATCTSESFILPLESLAHFPTRWGSHLQTFDPDDCELLPPNCWVGWRDWYNYTISFSVTGEYIAFADYQMPCMTHLAIFEIIREPEFSARLLRSTMIRSGPPRVKEVIFHKEWPLVAFLSENKVWVWELGKGK